MSYIPKPYLTSDAIIQAIVRKSGIPRNQNLFTSDDFLAFANEEMDLGLIPSIMQLHEDYLLATEIIPLTTTTNRYDIPARAIGNKLRGVSFRRNDGTENTTEMFRINRDNLGDYNVQASFNTNGGLYYYIENNQVVLLAQASTLTSGSLVMAYYIRPNRLVLLQDVGVITNIDTVTGQIVMSSVPSNFSTQQLYDFVSVISPHKTIQMDLTATGLDPLTKTITFDPNNLSARLQVGDHVCIAQTCAIPQVPSDLHIVLAHRASARCLESLGDQEGLAASNVKLAEYELKTPVLIDDRVEDSPLKIINRFGAVRRGLNYGRKRFGGR